MRMILFRQLELSRIEVEEQLRDWKPGFDSKDLLRQKKSALDEVDDYLKGFKWLSHKTSVQRVKVFLESGYNYKDSWKVVGAETQTSFETSIWYAAKKFQEKIGETTLKLLLQGRIGEGLRQFRISVGRLDLSHVIPSQVCDMLPPKKYTGTIPVSSCERELKFLKGLTVKNIKSKVLSADEDKLAFLRYVLEGTDQRFLKRRELLYNFLDGVTDDVEDLILILRHLDTTGEHDD